MTCSFVASPWPPKRHVCRQSWNISNRAVQTFGFFDPFLSKKEKSPTNKLVIAADCLLLWTKCLFIFAHLIFCFWGDVYCNLSLLLVAMEAAFCLGRFWQANFPTACRVSTLQASLQTHGDVLQHLCCPKDFICRTRSHQGKLAAWCTVVEEIRHPPVEVGSLSHYLPRLCRSSFISSSIHTSRFETFWNDLICECPNSFFAHFARFVNGECPSQLCPRLRPAFFPNTQLPFWRAATRLPGIAFD